MPRASRPRGANNAADRAAWEAATVVDATPWDGPGVHPGRVVATLRDVLPDDAILTTDAGNFAGWAGRGFRFRRPGDVPRPDVRRDGLRAAGRDRRRPRPPRSGGRGTHRRRRAGDDPVRAGDGRSRARAGHRPRLRQRAIRHHPDVAGPAGSRTGRGDRAGSHGLRRRRPGLRGRGRPRRARTPSSSRPSGAALAADGPTVIQLALDRALGLRGPAGRADARDLPPHPGRGLGRRPIRRRRSSATRWTPRASSTAPTGRTRSSRRPNRHYRDDPRDFLALTVDLDRVDQPVALRRPGQALSAHLRPDRPRGDHRASIGGRPIGRRTVPGPRRPVIENDSGIAAAILGPDVVVAAPPVDRVLRDGLEAQIRPGAGP